VRAMQRRASERERELESAVLLFDDGAMWSDLSGHELAREMDASQGSSGGSGHRQQAAKRTLRRACPVQRGSSQRSRANARCQHQARKHADVASRYPERSVCRPRARNRIVFGEAVTIAVAVRARTTLA